MADHFSGPRAIAEPAADITDVFAFPSPDRRGWVTLVLNVFPASRETTLFSDAIIYRFRLRPIVSMTRGPKAGFVTAEEEVIFDVTFSAPGAATAQKGTLVTSSGTQIEFDLNDETGAEREGVRIFSGCRLDPFFIDFVGVLLTEQLGRVALRSKASNALHGMNVLSIVLQVDSALLRRADLYAFVGETLAVGPLPRRIERMGRPEIKNVVMSAKNHDKINPGLEIRDPYNEEDVFALRPDHAATYRARLDANLAFFSGLSGSGAWKQSDGGGHPLTDLLLADYLVLDLTKPYAETGSTYEIETALLAGREHATCGGRPLNDDIVDTLYTLMISGPDGPRLSDGVDCATTPASEQFPYLAPPNRKPPKFKQMVIEFLQRTQKRR